MQSFTNMPFCKVFIVGILMAMYCLGVTAIVDQAGGSCASDTCRNSFLVCEGDVCKYKTGIDCSNSNEHCQSGTACEASSDECKIQLTEDCSGNPTECGEGLKCDTTSNTCRLSPGQSCAGVNADNCTTGTTCENDVCRLEVNETCSGSDANFCQAALVCDPNSRCRLGPGANCSALPDQCSAGTVCQSDICKPEAGESCAGGLSNSCSTGTICDSDICRLDVGESCMGANSGNCKTGTACEGGVCKLEKGGNCTGSNSDKCKSDLVCDSGVCKLSVGGACSGASTDCIAGTTCDIYICKLEPGGNCAGANFPYCTCGTACETDVCNIIISFWAVKMGRKKFPGPKLKVVTFNFKTGRTNKRIWRLDHLSSNNDWYKGTSGSSATQDAADSNHSFAEVKVDFPPENMPIAGPSSTSSTSAEGNVNGETSHAKRRRIEAESWADFRLKAVEVRVEEFGLAANICSFCGTDQATELVRCRDCGPHGLYCHECDDRIHRVVLWHQSHIWVENPGMFVPKQRQVMLRRTDSDSHQCASSAYTRRLVVFDTLGRHMSVMAEYCGCESESLTLLRYGLWPSSPKRPESAFTCQLMELCRSVQVEGQISMHKFCAALEGQQHFVPASQQRQPGLYRSLISDALTEYKHHHHALLESISAPEAKGCPTPVHTHTTK